jgi:1,2-diacylglycerol 3-alpha-glucosyltransferase
MKIGIFTCNYKPLINGLSSSIEIFSREFKARGHRVFIFAPQYPGHGAREEGVFRFPSLRAPTHHQYVLPLPFSFRIEEALPRLGLDILHAQHPFLLGTFALRAAGRLNLPLVFTHHTLYEEYAHYIPLFSGLVRRSAIRRSTSFANRSNLVIAPTRGLKEILKQRGVRTRIEVVPTGVEMEEDRKGAVAPEEFGIPSSAKILLSAGRLAREKNLYFLLSAFSRLARDVSDCYLILVGDGDERVRLEAWVRKQGLGTKVRFIGAQPRNQLARFYRGAHLLLFSSLSEAQGLVIAESMAQGLPVVALRSFAVEDLIDDGVNGYLADGPEMFLDRVRELLCHEGKRRAFAEEARKKARDFGASAMAEKMLNLYQELLEAKGRG